MINKMEKNASTARYLEIIFTWDEELCEFQPDFGDLDEEDSDTGIPYVSNGHWHGVIDLRKHILCDSKYMGWPYVLNAKVRDEGIYFLLDEDKAPICMKRGYVPKLPFDDKSWGDYIHLTVRDDGSIEDWDGEFDFDDFNEEAKPISKDEYEAQKRMCFKAVSTEPTAAENAMLEKAARLMLELDKGHTDKAGQPYFLHPMRVAIHCETPVQKTVAFLHDILEDAPLTAENLKEFGFTTEVIEAIESVTRRKDEDYESFIARCSLNPIGRCVKIRDLEDNLDVTRLKDADYASIPRINRYLKALRFLKSL